VPVKRGQTRGAATVLQGRDAILAPWTPSLKRRCAAGPFPQVKGSRITHDKLLAFIGRNYTVDANGAAFFQNGPQRVYVELASTPWIWRLTQAEGALRVHSHTGEPASVHSAWLDEAGCLYLACDGRPGGDARPRFGLVHSLDMMEAAQAVEAGAWPITACESGALPAQFGYVRQPRPKAST
jgi:hypothetical protein